MSLGAGGQRPNGKDWQKTSLLAGGAGLWEWDHRNAVLKLCIGAATILTGDPALAWHDLTLDAALARVHADDLDLISTKLIGAVYPLSAQLAQFRVCRAPRGIRRVLMRGRTRLDGEGAPKSTMGVVIDITDTDIIEDEWYVARADALDEAAQYGLATYNAVQASGIASLMGPARALLLEIGRQIAAGMKVDLGRPH